MAKQLTPEEEELGKKREQLTQMQAQLADRELCVANLRAELTAFENNYLRRVGILYSELDEWNAKLAELAARRDGTEEARSAARQARAHAKGPYAASTEIVTDPKGFRPSSELKGLYRRVAKQVHPDLAVDDADRSQRERLMAEANRAYENGDTEGLRRILDGYASSPESVRGSGVAMDLVRVLRQLKQINDRLTEIDKEIAVLNDSELATLKAKVEHASGEGRDLLTEMATNIQAVINVARHKYENEAAQIR